MSEKEKFENTIISCHPTDVVCFAARRLAEALNMITEIEGKGGESRGRR